MVGASTQIRSAIAGFFAWWLGELGAFVPDLVKKWVQKSKDRLVLDMANGAVIVRRKGKGSDREIGRLDPDESGGLSRLISARELARLETVLNLPASVALRRRFTLPLAAAENIREVMRFEMDRQTPFTAEQVYFDCRVLSRDTEKRQVDVELTACPRDEVDAKIRSAKLLGAVPTAIEIVRNSTGTERPVHIAIGAEEPGGPGVTERLTVALAIIALVLAATAIYLPLERKRLAAEALEAQVAEAKTVAEETARLRQQFDQRLKSSGYLATLKRETAPVVAILDEITRLLPDDTWLNQLQVTSGEIRLSGFSRGSSAIIAGIERSPMFAEARFRSPVTLDQRTGAERFTLSATINAPAGSQVDR